jgi:hypothetical protein
MPALSLANPLRFDLGGSPFPLLFELLGSDEGLNVPRADRDQEARRNIDQRKLVRYDSKEQNRQGKTHDYG